MTTETPQHGGNIFKEARRSGININKILDASASIVPFGAPKELKNHLAKSFENGTYQHYPEINYEELTNALSDYHEIDSQMIMPGNGASEILTWIGREASITGMSCIPSPGFNDYKRAINCWGGTYHESMLPLNWPECNNFEFPIQSNAEVIWITNPHNPTGQLWKKDSILKLLHIHKLVICDEAFLSIVPNGEKESIINLTKEFKNLIVIRSLTKLFSIPGLRLGYVIANSYLIKTWINLRDPWPINSIANEAGLFLLKNKFIYDKRVKKVHEWINSEKPKFINNLKQIPSLNIHHSCSNYFLIESNLGLSKLNKEVRSQNILLRDCQSFSGLNGNWLRISLQKNRDNIRIFNAIKNFYFKT